MTSILVFFVQNQLYNIIIGYSKNVNKPANPLKSPLPGAFFINQSEESMFSSDIIKRPW